MSTETELKLRLPSDSVKRLQRSPILKALGVSRPVTRKLHTIYYDTSDFDLWRSGFAFRLRHEGKYWIQSIKGGGSATAGIHQRSEWENLIAGSQPDFSKISDPSLVQLFDNESLRRQLRPVFATEFRRNARMLRLAGGSDVEFCIDQGTISTENASMPLCEIELELKSGSALPLYQLALDLLHTIPLRLENASKAERGYVLASGRVSPPFKSSPVELDTGMNVSQAFKAIAWSCLSHLGNNENGMMENRDIEYLHQMRVALRRERSAFSIFSKAFSKAALAPMREELKWLSDQLGPARDWDVFVTETFAKIFEHFSEHPGMLALRKSCEQVRREHNHHAREAVASSHYTELMLKLGAWLSAESWLIPAETPSNDAVENDRSEMEVKTFSGALLSQRHGQLEKYGKKLKKLSLTELHELRILIKKQRYAAEFFASLYRDKKAKRYIKSLAALQEILGTINDTAVIELLLSEVPAAEENGSEHEGIGIVRGWAASQAVTKMPELAVAWVEFEKNDPFW